MTNYEFFFSYKRDDWDNFMQDFLVDLKKEIARKTPRDVDDDFVFKDQGEIVLGQNWRPRLLDGLQNSSVLVPIYTPGYFKSEWCGREFQFFQNRMLKAAGIDFPCIIPVIWDVETHHIPKAIASIAYKDDTLPPEYSDKGMLLLTKLKGGRHKDAYWYSIEALSQAIVRAAKQKLPSLAEAPQPGDLHQVLSVFHPAPAGGSVPVSAPISANAPPGPGSVQFFYLAARKDELQQANKLALTYYHPNGGEYWRPGTNGQRLAALAAVIAGSKDLDLVAFNQPLDANFAQRLIQARDNNNIVVLFADAWSIELLPLYRSYAAAYDENAFFNSCLLVIWNEADPDLTDASRAHLQQCLGQVLRTASTRQEPYFVPQISGEVEFQGRLRQSLERLMHKVTELGQTNHAPEGMSRPTLPLHSGTQ